MRAKILALAILSCSTSFALAGNGIERLAQSCRGQAQIIAEVESSKISDNGCLTQVKNFRHYSSSIVCPLNESEILAKGLYLPPTNNLSCDYTGQEISGVVVLDEDGLLYLE